MPLPKPRPTENGNQFINRCMLDDTMQSEYPRRNQRYAVCNSLLTKKTLEKKQNKRRISNEFSNQIKIAQKKNYPIAYNFYLKNFEKAMDMYRNQDSAMNPNFNTLFKEEELLLTYKQMYRQTGLRFYLWYRKHFNLFVDKASKIEIERLLQRVERGQKLTPREMQTLKDTVLIGMDRYATQRANYLATAKEVTAINGIAIETLQKVITELTLNEEFMTLGLEPRVKEIMKRLKFKARWMARRVVQTETTAAANNGISLSAENIFGKDNLSKQWIAGGANIRDTHAIASSKYQKTPIESDKPYMVGSSLLMFPSDTSLGAMAKEVVNCKCVSIPFVKAD